jgi:hypothetical protein
VKVDWRGVGLWLSVCLVDWAVAAGQGMFVLAGWRVSGDGVPGVTGLAEGPKNMLSRLAWYVDL